MGWILGVAIGGFYEEIEVEIRSIGIGNDNLGI
jgi:hypothetical protein